MVHFVSNTVAPIVLLIQGAIYCWQVIGLGSITMTIMLGLMHYFGKKSHKKVNEISKLNDSANVSLKKYQFFSIFENFGEVLEFLMPNFSTTVIIFSDLCRNYRKYSDDSTFNARISFPLKIQMCH